MTGFCLDSPTTVVSNPDVIEEPMEDTAEPAGPPEWMEQDVCWQPEATEPDTEAPREKDPWLSALLEPFPTTGESSDEEGLLNSEDESRTPTESDSEPLPEPMATPSPACSSGNRRDLGLGAEVPRPCS